MGADCQRACRPRCDVAMNVAGTCTTLLMSRHTQTHRQVSRYLPHCPPSTGSRLHWTLPVCVGLKLKTTRHGQRANGRADGERFHVKLACRDTNDLKALNRSEQAAGYMLQATCCRQHREMAAPTSTEYSVRTWSRARSRVWVKPLQVSLARCVRNNLHSHQEFINCLWQLHSTPLALALALPLPASAAAAPSASFQSCHTRSPFAGTT